MKHVQQFENFIYLNESLSYQMINESKDIKIYKTIQDKTLSKLSINFYFANNFGWGVPMLYPIVESLIKNSDITNITKEQIVLLTLFSITQILNIANNDVKKIKNELDKNNIFELTKKIKDSILSVYNIFSFISRSFGKIIDSFIDMFAYVSLGVPFTLSIMELISEDGLDLDTLPQKLIVFSGGAAIYTAKSIVETIKELIKNRIKQSNNN